MDGDLPLFTVPWKQDGEQVTEELRVSVNTFKGTQYFAIRIWFLGRDGKQFFPGKSGINVPMDKAEEFVTMVDKGYTRLVTMAKHGHVDLPRRERQGGKRARRTPARPGTREEEQLQHESDERAGFNDRLEAQSDPLDPRD